MKPRLVIILLLIVAIPLGLMAWLGARMAANEQKVINQQFHEMLDGKLQDVKGTIAAFVATREKELLANLVLPSTNRVAELREQTRLSPVLRQMFVLNATGHRVFPSTTAGLTDKEREFLDRSGQVWKDQQIFFRTSEGAGDHGWYTWYWGNGVNIIFWRRTPDNQIIGAELDRSRFLADVIALLPNGDNITRGQIRLTDMTEQVFYEWGSYSPSPTELPKAILAVGEPLGTWHLQYFASSPASGELTRWTILAGLLAVGLALAGLTVYFYRESTREMREATQRISFVNQVSHELKTPLTNIRLYAELLEDSLPESNRHVSVIVAESQRLSRLIANVLRFARPHALHKATGQIDDVVRSVIEDFTPALEAKGVKIHFQANAPAPLAFDSDAVEQIIGNLLGNVEKYAPGFPVSIASWQEPGVTIITVADQGPGIPVHHREDIFKPFYRVSNQLSDGVAGTGIGLTIARDLARRHGGDLKLLPTEKGATFELRLPS